MPQRHGHNATLLAILFAIHLAACGSSSDDVVGNPNTNPTPNPTPGGTQIVGGRVDNTTPTLPPSATIDIVAGQAIPTPISIANTGASATECTIDETGANPALPEGLALSLSTTTPATCQFTGTPSTTATGATPLRLVARNTRGASTSIILINTHPDTLAQALDYPATFTTSGDAAWQIDTTTTTDGIDAAHTAPLSSTQSACLSTEVNVPGHYSFRWRILPTSANGSGSITFNTDTTQRLTHTGATPWLHHSADITANNTGTTTLQWCYTQAGSNPAALYLDQFQHYTGPIALRAEITSSTSITLHWKAHPNATHYRVLRHTTNNPHAASELTTGTSHTTTSFTDTGLSSGSTHHYWITACTTQSCTGPSRPIQATPRPADADADGLIEIATLTDLDNIRHNLLGTSYRHSATDDGLTSGCPRNTCRGYELTANLDFDTDKDGSSWSRSTRGIITLDIGDSTPHFDPPTGGWLPIGDCGDDDECGTSDDNNFNATFNGNGHTIANLAISRPAERLGLFTRLGRSAVITNLGLTDALAHYTTGDHSTRQVGILAGSSQATIAASYATGRAQGGGNSAASVGLLIGLIDSGVIIASFTQGAADGGPGARNIVGGLVGQQILGSITASYSTATITGGEGAGNNAGGLVGSANTITITASYANGPIDGGSSNNDHVIGALTGTCSSCTLTRSRGYGDLSNPGTTPGSEGDTTFLPGINNPTALTSGTIPTEWNSPTRETQGAWDFGTASQTPALRYADYDDRGERYACSSVSRPPTGAIIITNCDQLIPNQR